VGALSLGREKEKRRAPRGRETRDVPISDRGPPPPPLSSREANPARPRRGGRPGTRAEGPGRRACVARASSRGGKALRWSGAAEDEAAKRRDGGGQGAGKPGRTDLERRRRRRRDGLRRPAAGAEREPAGHRDVLRGGLVAGPETIEEGPLCGRERKTRGGVPGAGDLAEGDRGGGTSSDGRASAMLRAPCVGATGSKLRERKGQAKGKRTNENGSCGREGRPARRGAEQQEPAAEQPGKEGARRPRRSRQARRPRLVWRRPPRTRALPGAHKRAFVLQLPVITSANSAREKRKKGPEMLAAGFLGGIRGIGAHGGAGGGEETRRRERREKKTHTQGK